VNKPIMTTLHEAIEIGRKERYLAVVSTVRADATIQSSVVNVGGLAHPQSGEDVVAFVTYGRAKLVNLRARPQITVTFRSAGAWATVEGRAQLIGPDDVGSGIDEERLRLLRREVFAAAGGTHDDWASYDEIMVEQRRTVVIVHVTRIYSN
jgi:PPOX class probable F420-dependent enzyme